MSANIDASNPLCLAMNPVGWGWPSITEGATPSAAAAASNSAPLDVGINASVGATVDMECLPAGSDAVMPATLCDQVLITEDEEGDDWANPLSPSLTYHLLTNPPTVDDPWEVSDAWY